MSPRDSVKSVYKNYFKVSGRSTRSEFWWFVLVFQLVSLVINSLETVLLSGITFGFIYLIFILGSLIPYLMVTIRRFHDINKSGWWILIILIPVVGWVIYIIWLIRKSDEGSNRFGDKP